MGPRDFKWMTQGIMNFSYCVFLSCTILSKLPGIVMPWTAVRPTSVAVHCLPDGMGGRERLVSKSKDSVCLSGYCCLALQSPLPWTLASVNRKSAMLFTQLCVSMPWDPRLPPLGHVWDVMLVWRKGNINKNCLCVTVVCTIIIVHKDMSSSYRSVDCIRLWSCLVQLSVFQAPLCL